MDLRKLFDVDSGIYAESRPRYPAELYERLVEQVPNREKVWDVGCGNGQASVDLSRVFELVEATDVSSSQIEHSFHNERVRYSVQPAEQTDFPDRNFDAVCVAMALHWFDYDLFWPEVRRVLRDGGLFVAWRYNWPDVSASVKRKLEDGLYSVVRPYWSEKNSLLWNRDSDVAFPFSRIESPPLEMSITWSLEAFFSYLQSWSATRRCIEQVGREFFDSCYASVREDWGTDPRVVRMEFFVLAGRK